LRVYGATRTLRGEKPSDQRNQEKKSKSRGLLKAGRRGVPKKDGMGTPIQKSKENNRKFGWDSREIWGKNQPNV